MKTLKKAVQQNVELNTRYYSGAELKTMFMNKEIWYLKEKFEKTHEYDFCGYDYIEWCLGPEGRTLRIDCENTEIKVILNNDGYYTTVLIKNGKQYFVKL